jgi:hypothetical protein
MKKILLIPLIFMATVTALAASLVIGRILVPEGDKTLTQPLTELVPEEIPGWESTEIPIAQTPEGQEQVGRILRFDQAITRLYKRGNTEVMVYAAYWEPGKTSRSEVALHNPDTCWVSAGWERKDRSYSNRATWATDPLLPVEWGVFELRQQTSHVLFWHKHGQTTFVENQHGWKSDPVSRIKRKVLPFFEFLDNGLQPHREQIFLRISSNESIKPFFVPDHIQQLIEALPLMDHFKVDLLEQAALKPEESHHTES